MLELYLIRHPETLGGVDIIKGHNDIKLKPSWETPVDAIATWLANQGPFDAFFSSDLQRTLLPAKRIVDYLASQHQQPLVLQSLPELRERDMGIFQGRKYDEVDTGGKSLVDYVFEVEDIPKGETKSDVIKRVRRFVEEYLQKYIQGEGRVGIVGHGWWSNYLINSLLGDHLRPYNQMRNLDIVRLSIDGKNVNELLIKN